MTQINTTTTILPNEQPTHFSKISSQAKGTLAWAKDGLRSAVVSSYAIGVKSVELFKTSPQMLKETVSAASTTLQNYYSKRSASNVALDLTKVAVGSFAAYKAISFGPTNLANLMGRALYLPFEYADHGSNTALYTLIASIVTTLNLLRNIKKGGF